MVLIIIIFYQFWFCKNGFSTMFFHIFNREKEEKTLNEHDLSIPNTIRSDIELSSSHLF